MKFRKRRVKFSTIRRSHEKTEIEVTYYGTREFSTLDLHGSLLTFYENIE